MPHGMQLNTMATEITPLQAEGLLPGAKKAFLDGLVEFSTTDTHLFQMEFAGRLPSEVWKDSKFFVSTKGYVRALLINDIVNIWNAQTLAWDDNDHDE